MALQERKWDNLQPLRESIAAIAARLAAQDAWIFNATTRTHIRSKYVDFCSFHCVSVCASGLFLFLCLCLFLFLFLFLFCSIVFCVFWSVLSALLVCLDLCALLICRDLPPHQCK